MPVPSEELVVRAYREGDAQKILDLFNEVFAEGDADFHARSMDIWRWEFLDNPAGMQVVVAEEPGSGRIVAQYACLPARAHLRGRIVSIGQGIDSIVHREYRRGLKRQGAFLRTAQYYFDHFGVPARNAWGYGFPNQRAYGIGVKLLKYVPIAAPVPTLFRNLFQHAHDAEVGAGRAHDGEIVEVQRFDARADRFWTRLATAYPMAIRRDAAYLNWRYLDNPLARYVAFAFVERGGEYRGIAIVRPHWTGPPILAVQEWFVDPHAPEVTGALLAHVTRFARATGQHRIELWVPEAHPQFRAVRDNGFGVEPSLFNLCIKIYEPTLDVEWVKANWYWTIGDSDVF